METLKLINEFKSAKNVREVYSRNLDSLYNTFLSAIDHWKKVGSLNISRIKTHNLIYGKPITSTDIPVETAHCMCYTNLLNDDCFDGMLSTGMSDIKYFCIHYREILGTISIFDADTINDNKYNLLSNLNRIIKYMENSYKDIRAYHPMDPSDIKSYISKISVFKLLCDINMIIVKTLISILEHFTINETKADYMAMNINPGGISFQEIPNDISTLKEE